MEFTEIHCPKCNSTIMVNSQLHRCTCNNCGMDIVLSDDGSSSSAIDLYEQEKIRLKAQKDFQDEQDRLERERQQELEIIERKRQEEENRREHQRLLDSVNIPPKFGYFKDYVESIKNGALLFLILFAIGMATRESVMCNIAFICLLIPVVMKLYESYRNYNHIMEDVDAYKELCVNKLHDEMKDDKYNKAESQDYSGDHSTNLICPYCGSNNTTSQVFQENLGSKSWAKTKITIKEKGHGILWWIFIGWWWWIVDLLIWICLFIPRLIWELFSSGHKKEKFKGTAKTKGKTINKIGYTTMHTCHSCGRTWET